MGIRQPAGARCTETNPADIVLSIGVLLPMSNVAASSPDRRCRLRARIVRSDPGIRPHPACFSGTWTAIMKPGLPDGQPPASGSHPQAGGKSGLHRAACRLTAGGIRSKRILRKVPQRIYRPLFPRSFSSQRMQIGWRPKTLHSFFRDGQRVRVKRCGKSAPRAQQCVLAGQTPCGARPNRGAGAARSVRTSG